MRDCDRHPAAESRPGHGGVCASCLRERLTCLWRGESFRVGRFGNSLAASEEAAPRRDDAASQPECVGSIASVRKHLQVNGVASVGVLPPVAGGDVLNGEQRNGGALSPAVDGNPTVALNQDAQSSTDVRVEWAAFHTRRRRNLGLALETPKAQSRSFDSLELQPSVDALMDPDNALRVAVERSPGVSILMNAVKLRSHSMPLDNRSAEDTAQRVIREQADGLDLDDLDFLEALHDGGTCTLHSSVREQGCFSPAWQSRTSPKWVRVLISPMTSRNKVFPSRSKDDVRKGRGSRKRLTRFASSDWSRTDANGATSPMHWIEPLRAKEGMPAGHRRTTLRSSVFSWRQDSESTKSIKTHDQAGQLTSSSSPPAMDSGSMDTLLRDLITVGHLHEIAEEIEEEDEVLLADSLEDIASFGKFLRSAAQRHPKAGLTRLSSAAPSS